MKKSFFVLLIVLVLFPVVANASIPNFIPTQADNIYFVQFSDGFAYSSTQPFYVHHVVGSWYGMQQRTNFTRQYLWTGSEWMFVQTINFSHYAKIVAHPAYPSYTVSIVRSSHDIFLEMENHAWLTAPFTVFFSGRFLPSRSAQSLVPHLLNQVPLLAGVGILILFLTGLLPQLVLFLKRFLMV